MRRFALMLTVATTLVAAPALSAQTTISARSASIRIGGRLQTQYATSSVESYNPEFFFRRARLIADITVNDFFDARLQPEFAERGAELKDAYVRFKFAPTFQVSMGQFKRAFDLFELASSTDLSLIERDGRVGGVGSCAGVGGVCSYSRFTEKLGFSDRDQGIRIQGEQDELAYEVTVTNGTGANADEENGGKSYSGRLSVEVAPGLTVAGQYAFHDYVKPEDENNLAAAWSADVQWGAWRDGLLIQAALVQGDNWKHLNSAGVAPSFKAFQAALSYYAPLSGDRFAGVEPLVRVSFGDPNTGVDDDGGVVFTPGLMFYVMGKNKIGANVDVWSPQTGDTEYSFKVQSFLYF
jgi:hypothetical protein